MEDLIKQESCSRSQRSTPVRSASTFGCGSVGLRCYKLPEILEFTRIAAKLSDYNLRDDFPRDLTAFHFLISEMRNAKREQGATS